MRRGHDALCRSKRCVAGIRHSHNIFSGFRHTGVQSHANKNRSRLAPGFSTQVALPVKRSIQSIQGIVERGAE